MRRAAQALVAISRSLGRRWLPLSMLVSVAVVIAAAVWSSQRELDAVLADFSREQEALSVAVGADFEHRLAVHRAKSGAGRNEAAIVDETVLELLEGTRRLEEPGSRILVVARPGQEGFLTTDQRVIPSGRLRAAIDAGTAMVQVPRDEAVAFGLAQRTAVAGIERVASGPNGPWGVVVLASTERIRTREIHEEWRLVLTAGTVTLLVVAFGGGAMRRQRHELELARQVTVTTLEREREEALTAADKMAALAALGTGIAHEVGTPLGVIVGRIEQVLPRVASDERSRGALEIVLEQVERIRRIVNGCLGLARGDAPQLVRTTPASVARHAVDLVRHRFNKAGVEIGCEVDDGLPPIACDPSLFEQALVNVLLNACQASPRGGHVRLAVEATDGQVHFVVDDQGEGISDQVARRATEPFFSTRRGEGGSGLGLTIAREIVAHHTGSFSLARRADGHGTRATISIGA